jgi:hypothetical protein
MKPKRLSVLFVGMGLFLLPNVPVHAESILASVDLQLNLLEQAPIDFLDFSLQYPPVEPGPPRSGRVLWRSFARTTLTQR